VGRCGHQWTVLRRPTHNHALFHSAAACATAARGLDPGSHAIRQTHATTLRPISRSPFRVGQQVRQCRPSLPSAISARPSRRIRCRRYDKLKIGRPICCAFRWRPMMTHRKSDLCETNKCTETKRSVRFRGDRAEKFQDVKSNQQPQCRSFQGREGDSGQWKVCGPSHQVFTISISEDETCTLSRSTGGTSTDSERLPSAHLSSWSAVGRGPQGAHGGSPIDHNRNELRLPENNRYATMDAERTEVVS